MARWFRWTRTRNGYTPRLWPVVLVLPLWLFAAAAAAWGINVWLRARRDLIGDEPEALEVTRIVLSLVAGVGVVFVGVYAYRKQRIEEGTSRRADHGQFLDRYNAAADQLAHEKPAVRLAGVYAMAQLADDWCDQRQQCVDVLCAYLRMPAENDDPRHPDQEVRATVLRVIADHLRQFSAPTSWSKLNYNFDRALISESIFNDVTFRGEKTSFNNTTFTGDTTSFTRATFRGITSFDNATFSARITSFDDATFSGGHTSFEGAKFRGRLTAFPGAKFRGRVTWFQNATFSARITSFDDATFRGDIASFANTTFNWEPLSSNDAMLSGERTSFKDATFSADITSFDNATFSGGHTAFDDATFSGKLTAFRQVTLKRCRMTFDRAQRQPRAVVTGLENLKLENGATVTRDGGPFKGWSE